MIGPRTSLIEPGNWAHAPHPSQFVRAKLIDHTRYIEQYGENKPGIHMMKACRSESCGR